MNTIKLYKNPHPYPHYSDGLIIYDTIEATPRNQDLKSGFVDIQLSFDEILNFNYISFSGGSRTIYAWVDNIEEMSGGRFYRVHYNIDPFRTYRSDLVLGDQYVERSPEETFLFDPMLGSTRPYQDITRTYYTIKSSTKRYAVVQKKLDSDETYLATPVQPSPYKFYVCEYDVNDWTQTPAIYNLLNLLQMNEQSDNIVTIYSVPYVKTDNLPLKSLTVRDAEGNPIGSPVSGWKELTDIQDRLTTFTEITIPDGLTKKKSEVLIVIPEAGIMRVPPELYHETSLGIRQDIDLYSGACNYMLASVLGLRTFHLSVRGSSMSSIPILSDPYDTYISQNQNSLTTSLLGDVANIAVGGAMMYSGNPMGGGSIAAGATNLINKGANISDAKSMTSSNPPAFLGSALASEFHQGFWMLVFEDRVDNEDYVHNNLGYPCERFQPLVIPSTGFIKTQGCNLASNGSVPLWAINDINRLFDNGIVFH